MNHGRPLMSLRWAYQANVMNTFEQITRSVAWSRTGMVSQESRCLQRTYRQRADPDSLGFQHHDGAALDTRRYLPKIGEQQLDLAGRDSGCRSTKQNHRRPRRISNRENRAEVGIRRDDNPLITGRVLKNRYVICSRKPKIPHVYRIMVRLPQAFCDDR